MTTTKRALITGISGQDGSYLSEFLLARGYEVHGTVRQTSILDSGRLRTWNDDSQANSSRPILHFGDLEDGQSIPELILDLAPHEIYHLAAQSHVGVSFDQPQRTLLVNARGTLDLLEAARKLARRQSVRVYHASSSEMFGLTSEVPQRETTPFHPRSPYACSKVYGHHLTVNYREAYGLFACSGILFNHESPRRPETYVTRKITRAATRIKAGLQPKLKLGNIHARRDWGYAPEYVEAMWLMMQHPTPDDYVIATGETHSIQDFVEEAFSALQLDWHQFVEIDPSYFRPAEVQLVTGDPAKARQQLGWKPRTTFRQLVRLMIDADTLLAENERKSPR